MGKSCRSRGLSDRIGRRSDGLAIQANSTSPRDSTLKPEPPMRPRGKHQIERSFAQAIDQLLRQGLVELERYSRVPLVDLRDQARQPGDRDHLRHPEAQKPRHRIRRRKPFADLRRQAKHLLGVGHEFKPGHGDAGRPLPAIEELHAEAALKLRMRMEIVDCVVLRRAAAGVNPPSLTIQ